jgi:hypothetical protein
MLWLVAAAVFYPGESSVEMVDMRTKKLFLRKIRTEEVALKDLYIGIYLFYHCSGVGSVGTVKFIDPPGSGSGSFRIKNLKKI